MYSLYPSSVSLSPALHICGDWPVYTRTGRQASLGPYLSPRYSAHIQTTAKDPSLLTKGGDKDDSLCGGTLSVTASRNLFRKNRILYTMIVGVKKGGTLKKASLCMALVVLNSHLHGDGPICFSTVYTMTDWIREGFQGFPFCSWRVTVIHPGQCAGGKLR